MKVLIDLTSLDDNFSGIEHYALYMTKELVKNKSNHFHLVFKNKVKYFTDEELKQENISYEILSGGRKKILFFTLPKYVNKYRPEYAIFFAFPPSVFFKPKRGIKVISMIHDMVFVDAPETMTTFSRLYFKHSIKHALKISDEIITNSNFSKSRILFHNPKYNKEKIHVAYCGSSMPILSKPIEELNKKYGVPNNYLLALSTVEPRKNFSSLIKWLDNLWEEKKLDYDLVIAGRKGWKIEEILSNVKNIDRIHFTGFVDEEDISSIYKNSICFIFPSIYEGFGIPILESILSNKLPICSSIDVFKEILGDDYPFMFDCHSEKEFQSKLFEFFSCDEKEKGVILSKISEKTGIFNWKESAKVVESLIA